MQYQFVKTNTWVQSTYDPWVFVYQDTGANQQIGWGEAGVIQCQWPERWRFARADIDLGRWIYTPVIAPPNELLDIIRRYLEQS